jgi:hypothetical protein
MVTTSQQRRLHIFLFMLVPLLAASCIQSGATMRDRSTEVLSDSGRCRKIEIYSALINYCQLALVNNTNALSQCQLYYLWTDVLERKLHLEKADSSSIRARLAEPCIAGFKVAAESTVAALNSKPSSAGVLSEDNCTEELTGYRVYFTQKLVALYSQSLNEIKELEQSVTLRISNRTIVHEIIDAVYQARKNQEGRGNKEVVPLTKGGR